MISTMNLWQETRDSIKIIDCQAHRKRGELVLKKGIFRTLEVFYLILLAVNSAILKL